MTLEPAATAQQPAAPEQQPAAMGPPPAAPEQQPAAPEQQPAAIEPQPAGDAVAKQPLPPEEGFRQGLRIGVPFALAGFVLSLSFGVVAREAGMGALPAIVMSMIVFAGSAQFAAVAIIAGGGGIVAAVGAAALVNSRFLPMGVALAPSLPGGPLKRALQGQPIVDSSWAVANLGDGRFDRFVLFGTTAVQWVTWTLGTVAGVFGGSIIGDPKDLGLDAVFPAFFLSLLLSEMRDARSRGVAVGGAVIAVALIPFTPAGVPVLAASTAALIGLRQRSVAA